MARPAAPPVDEIARDLYALAPEEFVAARNARVKELTAAGDKDLAAQVKALRKPTVAIWALNQLSRTEQPRLHALAQTVQQLQSTEDVSAWRALNERFADQVQELVVRVRKDLAAAGRPAGTLEPRLGILIRTAITGPDRDALIEGRLDHEPHGDADAELMWGAPSAGTSKAKRPGADRTLKLRQRLRTAQSELNAAERELHEAEAALRDAERRVSRAQKSVTKLHATVERLTEDLDQIEQS
jgi:hypothetical protein